MVKSIMEYSEKEDIKISEVNMTEQEKTSWKIILGVIAMAILYGYVQYKCTQIINTIPNVGYKERVGVVPN